MENAVIHWLIRNIYSQSWTMATSVIQPTQTLNVWAISFVEIGVAGCSVCVRHSSITVETPVFTVSTHFSHYKQHLSITSTDFFRYYLSSAVYVWVCVCVFVCVYVLAITATPFNLELWSFGITILMWIFKNDFLRFLKNCFFPEILPFFYISFRFLCNFEEQLRKNQRI